jgi:long-chain fatty acid transport protein
MKRVIGAALLLSVWSVPAFAIGLDRSGQGVGIIFETENTVTLSFGHVKPSVDGVGAGPFTGAGATGNVTGSYNQIGLAMRQGLSDSLSLSVILDQPYGADIVYPTSGNGSLNGTKALFDTQAATAILRYKLNDNFSVHGGLKYQTVSAQVALSGAAYQGIFGSAGYEVDFAKEGGVGYVVGAAYERPEIALRVALTYHSDIDYDASTVERVGGGVFNSVTRIKTPEALNLDFQTGVAPGTLVFGSVRYAKYADSVVRPNGLGGASLTNFDNGFGYSIGVGRQFNDKISGFASFAYEPAGSAPTSSPLSPNNGVQTLTVGGAYKVSDAFTISGGISYSALGDTIVSEGGVDLNAMSSNHAVAAGFQVAYKF